MLKSKIFEKFEKFEKNENLLQHEIRHEIRHMIRHEAWHQTNYLSNVKMSNTWSMEEVNKKKNLT